MSLVSLSLVVLAAFIHATWNLLSKRAADAGPTFVFAYNLFACLVYLPWMIWLLVYGDLHWSLPVAGCLVLSACIHLAYSLCLQRGYQVADLSVVYPIARGTGPLLSSVGAFIILREAPSTQGILGLLAVVAGIGLHHHARRSRRVPAAARPRRGALGHRHGITDRELHCRRRLRRQDPRHSPGRARLGHQPAALLHHVARRSVEPASRAGEDEGLLAAGLRGRRAVAAVLHPRAVTPSRWARRSAWSRRRAKCR